MTGASRRRFTLTLDFYPNPDHAGIYMAREARLLRRRRPRRLDPDPLRPRGADQAGRRRPHATWRSPTSPRWCWPTSRASTWSPSGPLVDQPLTSMIWLQKSGIKGVADLRGKTIATAGIPYQDAYLKTILARAQPPPRRREDGQRRLRPAAGDRRRQRRGDARRLQQRRGRRPAHARQGPGRHPGRPARRPHLRRARPRRQPRAASKRTRSRSASSSPPWRAAPRPRSKSPAPRPRRCSRPTPTSTRS